MKIIKKENSEKNSFENIKSTEYPIGNQDINIAVIELNGRYPKSGLVYNKLSKELIYINKGAGTLNFNNNDIFQLNNGDVVLIEPNEKYFWNGNAELIIVCHPAWNKEQHNFIN